MGDRNHANFSGQTGIDKSAEQMPPTVSFPYITASVVPIRISTCMEIDTLEVSEANFEEIA